MQLRGKAVVKASDYAQVKHNLVDGNDETIRLPLSAPFHFVLAVVLVLVAHLVCLLIQRCESADAGGIERWEFLDLSVRRAGAGDGGQEILKRQHAHAGTAIRIRV